MSSRQSTVISQQFHTVKVNGYSVYPSQITKSVGTRYIASYTQNYQTLMSERPPIRSTLAGLIAAADLVKSRFEQGELLRAFRSVI